MNRWIACQTYTGRRPLTNSKCIARVLKQVKSSVKGLNVDGTGVCDEYDACSGLCLQHIKIKWSPMQWVHCNFHTLHLLACALCLNSGCKVVVIAIGHVFLTSFVFNTLRRKMGGWRTERTFIELQLDGYCIHVTGPSLFQRYCLANGGPFLWRFATLFDEFVHRFQVFLARIHFIYSSFVFSNEPFNPAFP